MYPLIGKSDDVTLSQTMFISFGSMLKVPSIKFVGAGGKLPTPTLSWLSKAESPNALWAT